MRAKLINEIQFKRGLNPKVAMDIGGINLEDVYIKTVIKGKKEWREFIESFIDKKVTFYLDPSKYISNLYKLDKPKTFVIKDVNYTGDGEVYFYDQDDEKYYVDVTKKIYVE